MTGEGNMALQTDKVQARIDPDLKESAEAILAVILGLTATDACMFYKQVKIYRGPPFDVRIPNAATPGCHTGGAGNSQSADQT